MVTEAYILVALAMVFGLYMAWNIGANDVANAMGSSVGSGALTLKRAVILAAIMEFTGAFFIGPHVTETVSKGIIDLEMLRTLGPEAEVAKALALGMLASLLAAGVWLQLASYFGWPVSTTHSIIGAIVGFGAVYGGVEAVNWMGSSNGNIFVATIRGNAGLLSIAASWVVSPLLSGFIAYFVFRFVLRQIFHRPDPVSAAKAATPWMVAAVMITMMLVLAFKGLKPFWSNYGLKPTDTHGIVEWLPWLSPLLISISLSLVSALVGAIVSHKLVKRIKPDEHSQSQMADAYQARSLSKSLMHLRRVRDSSTGAMRDEVSEMIAKSEKMFKELDRRSRQQTDSPAYQQVEKIFVYLQIISAAFVALAHGANDVANAIGPLSVVIQTAQEMKIPEKAGVPFWVLALGATGIVIGLATWGWRVIQTVGQRITELTPSRGFCAEYAAALTILIASVYKLPVSTTHTLVGAVLGVGLARGIGALNLNTIRDIIASWLVTVPAGAGLAILFYYALQLVF